MEKIILKTSFGIFNGNKHEDAYEFLGIPFAPRKQNYNTLTTIEFSLVFPALPNGTTQFDLIEPGDSDWRFYNIKITD